MTSRFKKVAAVTLFAAIISISAGVAYASEVTGSLSTGSQVVTGSHATGTLAGNVGGSSVTPSNSNDAEVLTNTSRSGGSRRSGAVATAQTAPEGSTFISFAGTVGEPEFTAPAAFAGTELASSDASEDDTAVITDSDIAVATSIDEEESIAEQENTDSLAAVGALGSINWGTWTMILVGLVAIGGIAYGVNRLIV